MPCCFQLQAFFLVADDIMDASVTRRGQPCWYKKVTLDPCLRNDIVLGLSVLLFTLCVCFPGWDRAGCHQWLISLRRFHLQTTSQTLQGSALLYPPTGAIYRGSIAPCWWNEHMRTHRQDPYTISVCVRYLSKQSSARLWTLWLPPLDRLTWTGSQWTGTTFILHYIITFTELLNLIYLFILSFRYKAIVKYKTAFYSFYLPVAAAMYIVSVKNLRATTEFL